MQDTRTRAITMQAMMTATTEGGALTEGQATTCGA